ncbi:class I SAM-dependent methyltransferase [Tenacibaculum sp. M341]|uniref:class I SAM-dependent methyltransferase n=1 Tax=Tenacibaculum sp. M341 TaxID=2530339 RepID=UPI00104B8A18|nr:class I SAM-dependent methyltransferase [Tenacibaculum sp. M341]TCI85853.1 class I SAM-dependent methyltransferase [Tenacibaculum sp. M341]
MKETTTHDLLKIEQQLSNPKGIEGIQMGEKMHERNFSMTKASFDTLNLVNDDHVLEIGHGNCSHLEYVFSLAENITYHGIEISETMYLEAKKQQKNTNSSYFKLYDGIIIPYASNSFDKIATINTIYFWRKPKLFLNEISRVLRLNGTCSICFADKSFMEKLPFVKEKFTLYNKDSFEQLILNTDLHIASIHEKKEEAISKTGDKLERKYNIVILKK